MKHHLIGVPKETLVVSYDLEHGCLVRPLRTVSDDGGAHTPVMDHMPTGYPEGSMIENAGMKASTGNMV